MYQISTLRQNSVLSQLARMTFVTLLIGGVNALTAQHGSAESTVGKWRGEWRSESTGHHGPLRARIRQVDEDQYRAVFTGRFFKVIPFIYPTKLERMDNPSTGEDETVEHLSSRQKLPFLGTYRMQATVSEDRFQATFEGRRDSGTFDLTR
ncbi:MAG: hypothetical protein L7U72_03355 [Rubripirellula sp.]|nr:hypothetical protein [Rubripirellula sp.]